MSHFPDSDEKTNRCLTSEKTKCVQSELSTPFPVAPPFWKVVQFTQGIHDRSDQTEVDKSHFRAVIGHILFLTPGVSSLPGFRQDLVNGLNFCANDREEFIPKEALSRRLTDWTLRNEWFAQLSRFSMAVFQSLHQ
jgi:hypothetical protein